MKLKVILPALLPLILLASCVTSRKVNMLQEPSKTIASYVDTLSYEDYLIRKGDRLYIHIYSIDEKTSNLLNEGVSGTNNNYLFYSNNAQNGGSNMDLYTYVVDDDGYITFPTIDKLYVRGLTTREVKFLLEDQLSGMVQTLGNQSMLSAEVQVVQRSFSIIGPQKSGRYYLQKEKLNIFEALALAGNIGGDFAYRSKVMLIREIEDSVYVKTFDLRSKDIIHSEFYYIEPNDVIYVRYMPGYSFGLTHVTSVIGITASTISFGVFLYTLGRNIYYWIDKAANPDKYKAPAIMKGGGGL